MECIIYNGKLLSAETPMLLPGSRGLRFGEGVFETMKCSNGELLFPDEHFARLWKGMQVLQFSFPRHFTPEMLQSRIAQLTEKNNHGKKARVRLTVFKGEGGLYDDISHAPDYLVQTWALPPQNGEWNSNGLVLGFYTDVKKQPDILSNIKHNNFLLYTLAARHAKNEKWNDAVVLNTNGHICETTIANLFMIKDGQLYTPHLAQGCIAGIMRQHIISRLTAINQPVQETCITADDLLAADEVFLTNSIYNIRWVQRIADTGYACNQTFEIYNRLFATKT